MGWYRRSIFDAFRRYSWKNAWNPKGLVSISSVSRNNNINALILRPDYNILRFSPPMFRFQKNHSNSLISGRGGAMRKMFYSVLQQLRKKARYLPHIAVSGLVITNLAAEVISYKCSETVPYSKRKHVTIVDWDDEKKMTSPSFEKIKASYGKKILPPDHPQSITVQRIGRNIVEALRGGLKTHQLNHENLKHLEDLEFIVVDVPEINAHCHPGGKIIVFTGILEHLKSDAEIAAVIGHEVAHAIARHVAETFSHFMLHLLRTMLLPLVTMPIGAEILFHIYETLFLRLLPFSRRLETEADYIGMLLMASARYDPRVAPLMRKKMAEIFGKQTIWESISGATHPSNEKRAKFLSSPEVMKEAMCLYREAQFRQGISLAISKQRRRQGWAKLGLGPLLNLVQF